MRQKLFLFLFALLASTGISYAEVYNGTCGDHLTWSLDTETGVLTISGSGSMTDWKSNNGAPWSSYRSSISSISLPDGLTGIGNYAFYNCSSLTSVTIPNSVTNIGADAFSNVPNIIYAGSATGSPWGARSVNGYVEGYLVYSDASRTNLLACYTAVTGKIVIPESVTNIENSAFYGCSSLTSITIPNSVTSIGNSAFMYCSNLTSVTIGNSVTTIGANVFYGCSSLTTVTIPNSVTNIGEYAFSGSSLTTVTIPNSVTSIGAYAFSGSSLTTVTIPNSVTSIGRYAFSSCSSLTSVTIPNSVTNIEYRAFSSCSSLTNVTIGNSVTSIGQEAFFGCHSLTSVEIPNSVTSIGDRAFSYCNLKKITINSNINIITLGGSSFRTIFGGGMEELILGDGVTQIGQNVFNGYNYLKSVTIGKNITSIESNAFSDCDNITSVIWNACNCDIIKDRNTILTKVHLFPNNTNITSFILGNDVEKIPASLCYEMTGLTSIIIPSNVKTIGVDAFNNCNNLKFITIGDNVTSILNRAFQYCKSLTNIIIPHSVTTIGDYAFYGCTSLSSLSLGKNITTYGAYAFAECPNITTIYNYRERPATLKTSTTGADQFVFKDINSFSCTLYVPNGSVDMYKSSHSDWSELFYFIEPFDAQEDTPTILQEDTSAAPLNQSNKVIREGKIMIENGDKIYTLTGAEIK